MSDYSCGSPYVAGFLASAAFTFLPPFYRVTKHTSGTHPCARGWEIVSIDPRSLTSCRNPVPTSKLSVCLLCRNCRDKGHTARGRADKWPTPHSSGASDRRTSARKSIDNIIVKSEANKSKPVVSTDALPPPPRKWVCLAPQSFQAEQSGIGSGVDDRQDSLVGSI